MATTQRCLFVLLTSPLAIAPFGTAQEQRADSESGNLQPAAESLPPIYSPDFRVGEAMLFDLGSGELIKTFRSYRDHLRHAQFTPDCRHAMLSFHGYSVLMEIESGDVVREFGQGGMAQFSSDGSTVLIFDEFYATRYEVATGKQLESILLPSSGLGVRHDGIGRNAVRSDASRSLIFGRRNNQILDAQTAKLVGRFPGYTHGHSYDWPLVSGKTKRVFVAAVFGTVNTVQVFNFEQEEVARFDMPPGELKGLEGEVRAVSSDGKRFLYARSVKGGGFNPGPKAWARTRLYSLHDAETGKELKTLGRYDSGYSSHFSHDGHLTVLLPRFGPQGNDSRDPEIVVIDNATGGQRCRPYTGPWGLSSIDFDSINKRLLVGGAIDVNAWRNYEWMQMERQKPMPRKVVDMLKILKDGLVYCGGNS